MILRQAWRMLARDGRAGELRVLGMATALLILPLLAIIGLLVMKGFPVLSLEFLF